MGRALALPRRAFAWAVRGSWRLLVWLVCVPWRLIAFPFRLSRRRISVQLILSYVLVVMLTALVLEIAAIVLIFGVAPRYVGSNTPDSAMGLRAEAAARELQATFAAASAPGDSAPPARQSDHFERILAGLTDDPLPSSAPTLAAATSDPRAVIEAQLGSLTRSDSGDTGQVANALLVNDSGTIVASTDHQWAPLGAAVGAVHFRPVVTVTERALQLQGSPTGYGNEYVLDAAERMTAAAYPILDDQGSLAYVVTLQGQPEPSWLTTLWKLAAGLGVASIVYLAAMTLVALVVATPVGIWRARALSRRLKRLSAAADAMALGDLDRRVQVNSQDEIGRLSEHFNEMIARLAATDRARKAFVANVSHELRTPLAIIQGNIERVLARDTAGVNGRDGGTSGGAVTVLGEPPANAAELRVIYQETLTLGRLIDDLFTLARLEETTLPLETAPLQLHELAGQAVASLQPLAWEQRKVTVRSLVRAGLPPVLADPTRLRQILNNLLYNALRHTPEGGVIVVDAAARDGMIEIAVTDTGIGIAPEELGSVFERFYRSERGRHPDGSGLGLHIVKQLVEAQRGTIAVESTLGQGTTFRVRLPRA